MLISLCTWWPPSVAGRSAAYTSVGDWWKLTCILFSSPSLGTRWIPSVDPRLTAPAYGYLGMFQLPLSFPENRPFCLFKIILLIDTTRNNICMIPYKSELTKLSPSFLIQSLIWWIHIFPNFGLVPWEEKKWK